MFPNIETLVFPISNRCLRDDSLYAPCSMHYAFGDFTLYYPRLGKDGCGSEEVEEESCKSFHTKLWAKRRITGFSEIGL